MKALNDALKGKKTYLLAAIYILLVGFGAIQDNGTIYLADLQEMVTGGMVATLRAALA